MSLGDSLIAGINNPDCAFFVGQSVGYGQAGTLIFRIALIYYGIKIMDKILFTGLPKLFKNKGKGFGGGISRVKGKKRKSDV